MRGLSLGTIAGIRVVIDPTWLFIFSLVVFSLATAYFPAVDPGAGTVRAWSLGLLAALLLFASVLVHEIAHALVARRAGIPVKRIRLFLFGGLSETSSDPCDPGTELRIAAAGPATNLVLAGLFWAAARLSLPAPLPGGMLIARYMVVANLSLAIFNLLPGLPLDGGRILRAWLWSRRGTLVTATRSAGRAGTVVGYALMALGPVAFVRGALLSGVWLILIGFFLSRAAGSSYHAVLFKHLLSGVSVRQLMTRPVVSVPEHASLDEVVTDYIYRHRHGSFPVATGDLLAGVVSLDQLKRVPREEWVRTPVRSVMTPAARVHPLGPEESCVTALERMIRDGVTRLVVVVEGRIVGILSRRDVLRFFRLRTTLAP